MIEKLPYEKGRVAEIATLLGVTIPKLSRVLIPEGFERTPQTLHLWNSGGVKEAPGEWTDFTAAAERYRLKSIQRLQGAALKSAKKFEKSRHMRARGRGQMRLAA
jgi:hypothetical protein